MRHGRDFLFAGGKRAMNAGALRLKQMYNLFNVVLGVELYLLTWKKSIPRPSGRNVCSGEGSAIFFLP